MSLLTICLVIILVGFLLWTIQTLIPMEGNVKKILSAVVIISLIIWLLRIFGVWAYLDRVHF